VDRLEEARIPYWFLGFVGGSSVEIGSGRVDQIRADIPLADLRAAHEGFFPKLMGSELTPEF
jgi:hypothetical protein